MLPRETYRDDQVTYIVLSLLGILGWPGALAGTMLAGLADAWKGAGSGPLMPPVDQAEGSARNNLAILPFGLVAGATAFGVPSAFGLASEHWNPVLLGIGAGVVCSLLPLVEEAVSRRGLISKSAAAKSHELDRRIEPMVERVRVARRGVKKKRVWFPEWDKGYYVATGVGACSLGVAALGRESPRFGLCTLGAFLACRPIVWLGKRWLHRR